jgi:hypothetical protein
MRSWVGYLFVAIVNRTRTIMAATTAYTMSSDTFYIAHAHYCNCDIVSRPYYDRHACVSAIRATISIFIYAHDFDKCLHGNYIVRHTLSNVAKGSLSKVILPVITETKTSNQKRNNQVNGTSMIMHILDRMFLFYQLFQSV